ncbi:MAG: hypothetical protein IH627_14405 [Rubrivivax sp.]|nr:hypothetical protein [Rubrivivax sp.]
MEAQSILIKLHDESPGYVISPSRVPLATLRAFVAEVSNLLRGDVGAPELQTADVAVVEGSLGILTTPLADAALWADLRSLTQSDLLDGLNPRRRKVLEGWQAQARARRHLRFEISSPALARTVIVSAETDFRADDADQWVRVERYVRGEIEDLGGAVKANAHIRLPDGKLLTVDTDRTVLRDDKSNRLYKPAMVRITAEYNVVTREYRAARLIEFVEHEARFDEREFARFTERGAKAWKDVPDASAWVEALRGSQG